MSSVQPIEFSEGYEAYNDLVPDTKNPYDPSDDFDKHTAWNDGWAAAQAEDMEDDDE